MNNYAREEHNQKIIDIIKPIVKKGKYFPPSYSSICTHLATLSMKTTRGNDWTPKRLFRMLQRMGYSGLFGLFIAK